MPIPSRPQDSGKKLSGIFRYELDQNGKLSYIDPTISELTGYSPEEFSANWNNDFLSTPSHPKSPSLNLHDSHCDGDEEKRELKVRHISGESMWLRLHERKYFDAKNNLLRIEGAGVDITAHKNLELGLRNKLEWHKALSHAAPIGIFQIDPDDMFTYTNPACERIAGTGLKSMLGMKWWEIIHPEDQSKVFEHWARAETEEKSFFRECRVITATGETKWIHLCSNFLFSDFGKSTFGTIEDISIRKKIQSKNEALIQELTDLKNQLELAAKTDPLTKLLNRRGIEERFVEEIARNSRSKKPFCLILCDIDFFKKVNDTHGHDAGDHILIEVALLLKKEVRKQDMICRWGGEEFLMVLPETSLEGGERLAEKIRSCIESQKPVFAGKDIPVTMSLGIAEFNEKSNDIDTIIKQADNCLYHAKKSGRNQSVSSFSSDQDSFAFPIIG